MIAKPKAKPVVLGVLNPLANGRLTIKQNKTKQNKIRWVLVQGTKTKTHRTCLLVNLTSKVLSLASSLCGLVLCGSFERQRRIFQQVFNRVFHNDTKRGVFECLEQRPTI